VPSSPDGVETAWRIHSALADWTAKVDTKASFALTLEVAVLAGVVTLTGSGHHLHGLHGAWVLTFFWTGIGLLVTSGLASAAVVTPQIRRSKIDPEAAENFIFFGHVRRWEPDDLAYALENRDLLPVLSRQLVVMSRIAWNKHVLLQVSMLCATAGTALITAAYLIK
jgi:hypothetical protein